MPEIVDTLDQLFALPYGTVVYSKAGTIAARFDKTRGVCFGDDRPIPWRDLALPAEVLWRPDRPAPQWDPPPDPAVDTFDDLLDFPPGTVIRTITCGTVFEKFADHHWYRTGLAASTSIDRVESMLPARMIWHPRWANA